MDRARRQIRELLEGKDNFLVASHQNPDGDALGSMVAMGWILKALGKDFRLYNESGLPGIFSWLDMPAPLFSTFEEMGRFKPDWYIILDCGDPFRAGRELLEAVEPDQIVNIDHHLGNPFFGAYNWVDTSMSAVGEMVGLLADDLDIPLSGALGEAVYLAVLTDTGNFTFGNTRPEALELAARIMRLGLSPAEFSARYENQWTINRLMLWSAVLGKASLHYDGVVGVLRIPLALLEETGTTPLDCDGLVNYLRRLKGVRVAIILREDGENTVKVSLRSHGSDNVQKIAAEFGGGGHRNASGARMAGTMDEAQEELLLAVARNLELDHAPENDGA